MPILETPSTSETAQARGRGTINYVINHKLTIIIFAKTFMKYVVNLIMMADMMLWCSEI